MMIKLGFLGVLTMAATMGLTGPGCSDNAVDRAYDCDAICDKWKECGDANYDDGACADRCRDAAADSEAYEDKADECQACIDDRSCVGAAFGCGTECAGIVP